MRTPTSLAAGLLVFCLALLLPGSASAKQMISGVLEGDRFQIFVCEIVNKSGDVLTGASLGLRAPDASQIGGVLACPVLADGESCALEHRIYPVGDLAAYCQADLPDAFVRGGLHLIDKYRTTLAESDLQTDVEGEVATLSETVSEVSDRVSDLFALYAPPKAIAFVDVNGNNDFDPQDKLIAKWADANLDGVPSAGDALVLEVYPLDFAAADFGIVGARLVRCESVMIVQDKITCHTGDGAFWFSSNAAEHEFRRVDATSFWIRDNKDGTEDDRLQIGNGAFSILVPSINVFDTQPGGADDDFIDVQFFNVDFPGP